VIYVSAQHGDDTNAGTLAAPFRQISKAIAQSVAGDTVVVLDSGDYSQFTVNKSLTIAAECAHAEVSAPAGAYGNSAVTVNAGATGIVVLRGLTIKSTGGTVGIWVSSTKYVRVENCTISNFANTPAGFPGYGIQVGNGILTVKDSVLRDNSVGFYFGAGSNVRGVIDRCRIEGDGSSNATGLEIFASAHVTVRDSVISGHGNEGIYIRGYTGSPVPLLTLIDSTITHNRIGIYADRTGQVHLVYSTVTLNDRGLFTLNNGVIYTAGNNAVIGNLVANMDPGANVVFFKSDKTV
jgi:hypothetical protein